MTLPPNVNLPTDPIGRLLQLTTIEIAGAIRTWPPGEFIVPRPEQHVRIPRTQDMSLNKLASGGSPFDPPDPSDQFRK